MKGRTLYVAVLVIALVIAGVGSLYASGHPDGLEYVAGKAGFLTSAEDSPTTGSPFAATTIQVVIAGGEYHGRTGHGEYLHRELSQYLI